MSLALVELILHSNRIIESWQSWSLFLAYSQCIMEILIAAVNRSLEILNSFSSRRMPKLLYLMPYCHIAIRLVLLLFFFLLGRPLSLNPKAPSFQIRSGWNLARLFLEWIRIAWWSRISDMTSCFQDGDHDVISPRKSSSPPRHACDVIGSLYALHCYSSWSTVRSYLCQVVCSRGDHIAL